MINSFLYILCFLSIFVSQLNSPIICVCPPRIHSSDTPHLLWPFFSKTTKVPIFCLINSSCTTIVYTRKDVLCHVISHLNFLMSSLVNTKALRIYDSLSHQKCAIFSRIQTQTLYTSCALTSTQGSLYFCSWFWCPSVDDHEPREHL